MASIRRVLPQSPPNAVSTVPEGTVLALKLARSDDKLAEEALAREVESFVALSRAPGSPPCPRLYDIVGNPVSGIVMEWCPTDMERWWETTWSEPRAFVELCEALADICRRVREYAAVAELELGKRVIHADIKPRNVLRAVDGRWLLTDFGAAKSRSVDETQWAATRMILGTENFIAPEALFNARKPHPAAMDTWSIGCTFFALLRMRTLLRGGGKLPANGTHAHLFRSQRVALVGDLQQRKPALFVDKELDPAEFSSPDKLPEKDRRAVAEALDGIYGKPNATLEGVLATEVLHLLDRALRIDPAMRFRNPLEMAGEFEAMAQRFRELALRADGGIGSARMGGSGEVRAGGAGPGVGEAASGRPEASAPEGAASGPRASGGSVESGPRASGGAAGSGPNDDGRGARGSGDGPPRGGGRASGEAAGASAPRTAGASAERARDAARGGASAPRLLVGEEIEVEEGTGKRAAAPAPRVPRWMSAALIAAIGLQGVQIGVVILTLAIALDARSTAADALEIVTAARATPTGVASAPPAAPAPTSGSETVAPSGPPLAALVEEAEAMPAPTAGASATGEPAASAPAVGTGAANGASGTAVSSGAVVGGGRSASPSKRAEAPASAAPSEGTGLVLVSGAQAYLMGPSGRMPVGGVAAGTYELFAQTRADGDFESQGTVRVGAGERIVYKCGFGTCRRSP